MINKYLGKYAYLLIALVSATEGAYTTATSAISMLRYLLYYLNELSGRRTLVGLYRSPIYWVHCIIPLLAVVWEGKT